MAESDSRAHQMTNTVTNQEMTNEMKQDKTIEKTAQKVKWRPNNNSLPEGTYSSKTTECLG